MQKWHLQYKTSDISETKQSKAKLTKECLQKLVYDLSIGDKSGLPRMKFSGEKNFSTTNISHTFCQR